MSAHIEDIQQALREQKIDGWLFVSFRHSNPFMDRLLGLDNSHVQSRRCAYFIPSQGEPSKLVHGIEPRQLDVLPGSTHVYVGWREFEGGLKKILSSSKRVAMEYSPGNAVPTVSIVDGGTIDLVRACGCEVVSSANLVQQFEAAWTPEEYESHKLAAQCLSESVDAVFAEIAKRVKAQGGTDEYAMQQFIMDYFEAHGMTTHHHVVVAVNANSADPHYQPTADHFLPIKKGDFVLVDIWCKQKNKPNAMYADITWVGYVGETVPEKYQKIFSIVAAARDAASAFVTESFAAKRPITGAQVDDACRDVIVKAGYGDKFIHRTGHSIGTEVHGNGVNIDNLETRDERLVIPRTCFSIEPGIYLTGDFGVRSEIDVYVDETGKPIETGRPKQMEVRALLK